MSTPSWQFHLHKATLFLCVSLSFSVVCPRNGWRQGGKALKSCSTTKIIPIFFGIIRYLRERQARPLTNTSTWWANAGVTVFPLQYERPANQLSEPGVGILLGWL